MIEVTLLTPYPQQNDFDHETRRARRDHDPAFNAAAQERGSITSYFWEMPVSS
jgi:hypothetical protein